MKNIDAAQYWVGQGISVIPCGYRSKKPDFSALSRVGSKDKNGRAMWQTYIERLPTVEELRSWFSSKWRNVAVVTGWLGLAILDFDCLQKFSEWYLWAYEHNRPLTKTYMVMTGRPGMHVYQLLREPLLRTIKLNGLDIKAGGGYCLTSPSVHPSGYTYQPIQGRVNMADSLDSVLPCMWLSEVERQLQPVTVQPVSYGPFDVVPDGAAARIKQQYKVLDFFPDAQLSSDGRWYKTVCPLHNDHEASGWIDTQRNRYGCHKCIQGSIDVIELYARLNGVDSRAAIRAM